MQLETATLNVSHRGYVALHNQGVSQYRTLLAQVILTLLEKPARNTLSAGVGRNESLKDITNPADFAVHGGVPQGTSC